MSSALGGWLKKLPTCDTRSPIGTRAGSLSLELEAGPKRGLGDLDLRGRRLRGGEAVLQLVAGARKRPRQALLGVARHPAEELGGRGDGAERAERAGRGTERKRRLLRERVRGGRSDDERADEVRTAALVLPRARLVVLVRPDRDVLGAVVGGQVAAAQREERGSEGQERDG